MREPNIFHIDTLKDWDVEKQLSNSSWVPARPDPPNYGLKTRLKVAWLVFTGQCDAVEWRYPIN